MIDTPRLTLRKLEASDVSKEYVGWLNDPDVFRFLETRWSEQTEQTVAAFIAAVNANPSEHLFGIFLRSDGRHIGNIKVGPVNPHHGLGDVSLLIGARDCWGHGYATEAIAALSRHAFTTLGVRKLSASMYEENQGSYKSFLKVGYLEEGRRRAHYILDGQPSTLIQLGLLSAELDRIRG